jgi:hypothetical protein
MESDVQGRYIRKMNQAAFKSTAARSRMQYDDDQLWLPFCRSEELLLSVHALLLLLQLSMLIIEAQQAMHS